MKICLFQVRLLQQSGGISLRLALQDANGSHTDAVARIDSCFVDVVDMRG